MTPKRFFSWFLGATLLVSTGVQAQRVIDLQGHRGARGLAPENTLSGFAKAIGLGVTTLELDVVVTQDEQLVIHHDLTLNPAITRDASGQFISSRPAIIGMTMGQLRKFDVGRIDPATPYGREFASQQGEDSIAVPRLGELLEVMKAPGNEKVKLAIEIKITPQAPGLTPAPERFVQLLLREIDNHGMKPRVQVLSFDWRVLQIIQRLSPGLPTVYLTAQLPALDTLQIKARRDSPWTAGFQYSQYGSVPKMIKAAGGSHWSSFWRELDADSVREAQGLGLKVLAWTVNDREAMGKMLDLGVDGLVTDRPDIAAELLKERGIRW